MCPTRSTAADACATAVVYSNVFLTTRGRATRWILIGKGWSSFALCGGRLTFERSRDGLLAGTGWVESELLISRMLANAFSGSSPFGLIEIGSNPDTGRKAIRRLMIDNTLFALV